MTPARADVALSELGKGRRALPGHGEVEVFIEDRLRLEPFEGEGNRHLLTGVAPATSREAGVALQYGKLPTELKLKAIKEVAEARKQAAKAQEQQEKQKFILIISQLFLLWLLGLAFLLTFNYLYYH